jgi:sugar lactone lactonase YvrE
VTTPTPVPTPDPVPNPNPGARVDTYEVAKVATSGSGGGQGDDRGNMYVANGNKVSIFDKNQKEIGSFPVPAGAVDVAPAPDGSSAFVVSRVGNKYEPQRYVKGADGTWSRDMAFKLEQFPYGGRMHDAEGMRIATDAHGNLFVADGVWSGNSLNTVIKFDSTGKYQTRFGEYVEGNPGDASSWEQGKFYWSLGGIAVSRDGNTVYTTEVGNNRVQKWEAQEGGDYKSTKMWGNTQETDPNRAGDSKPGMFAAPYDIGIDQWGDVYVVNTTVSQIQKFTPDGEHILSMNVGSKNGAFTEGERSHGLAVDMYGNAISTETGIVMRRTEDETREVPPMRDAPKPDKEAPKLNGFTLPEFADGPKVTISIDATDDRRPAEVRLADENGTFGPWIPFTKELEVTLSDGPGVKGIYVQVRDAAGNESESVYHTLLRRAPEEPAEAVADADA